MIFVDSNIPMYLVGAEHPNKHRAQRLVDGANSRRDAMLTSTEVFQEILHRYGAIDRLDAVQPAFDVLLAVVSEVFPIDLEAIQIAKRIMMGRLGLSARDALHVAVMEQAGITRIMSFDTGFDVFPSVERVS
ncbi:MAG: type II toxin-antitoxin system VapC family toxin [Geodermatophilaceae bacterium]